MKERNNGALAGKATSVGQGPASSKAEEWRVVDSTIGQLLLLVSQRAAHDVLVRKVESLHSQIQALFPKPPSKAEAGNSPWNHEIDETHENGTMLGEQIPHRQGHWGNLRKPQSFRARLFEIVRKLR